MMLNIVADKEGAGAAVLIRSCAPISGNVLYSIVLLIYSIVYKYNHSVTCCVLPFCPSILTCFASLEQSTLCPLDSLCVIDSSYG